MNHIGFRSVYFTGLSRFTLSHCGSHTPLPTLKPGLTASAPRLSTGCLPSFTGPGVSPGYTAHTEPAHPCFYYTTVISSPHLFFVRCGPRNTLQTISTHAPTWGATATVTGNRGFGKISTHAPAWGATFPPRLPRRPASRFQLTPPRGGRHAEPGQGYKESPISTHAPAWGATAVIV